MGLKLSDLNPNDVEVIGDSNTVMGRGPSKPSLKLSDFHPSEVEYVQPDVDPKTSPATAAATGIIEGAVPFASAIAGAGKAGMNAITGVTGPLAGGSLGDVMDDYRQARDSFSQDAKTAADANPKTAFAGNIAGGIANPLFHGADSIPKVMGAGAVQALGTSDADLTKPGDVKEVNRAAKDAAIGAAGGAVGYGVAKAIPEVAQGLGWIGKKALTTLGPSEEAINARLAGRAQPTARSYPELAEDLSGSVKGLKGQIGDLGKEATQTLSVEPTIPKGYVTAPIDEAVEALGVQGKLVGPTDKRVSETLSALKSDLESLGDTISERDLKGLIKNMDDNINWDDQSQDKLNRVLEGLRSKFDQTLKFQNSNYKNAMEPISQRMSVLDNIKRQFNLRNIPGQGLQPTDTTATKMQTALRENKAVTQDTLDQLKGFTGDDYQDLAKDYQLSHQFENTGPNGSRRTVLGGAVGGLLGHGTPGAIGLGAGTGAILDRYGGQAVGKMIDGYVKAGNSAAFGKFKPIIDAAAAKGPEALAVTGSILSRDPDFRKLMGLDSSQ
jgi:hypothetical protein